jgi:hypothetical protein
MPRLKFIAKVLGSLFLLIILYKILAQPPPAPPEPDKPPPPLAPNIPEGEGEPTEREMIEWAAREEWVWKDFEMYVDVDA